MLFYWPFCIQDNQICTLSILTNSYFNFLFNYLYRKCLFQILILCLQLKICHHYFFILKLQTILLTLFLFKILFLYCRLHNGKPISDGGRYKYGLISDKHNHIVSLEVQNVVAGDGGEYKAVAKNKHGDSQANITLNFESKIHSLIFFI